MWCDMWQCVIPITLKLVWLAHHTVSFIAQINVICILCLLPIATATNLAFGYATSITLDYDWWANIHSLPFQTIKDELIA